MFTQHEKANEQKWNRRSQSYDEKRFDWFRWMQKQALALMDLQRGDSFLDLGCGTGWAVCYVANLLEEQGQFIGVDISDGMIAKAKEKSLGLKNVSFYHASVEKLPIENEQVNKVLCTNSFHHYLNPEAALTEVYRVMKAKGRIYILDVTSDDFFINWMDRRAARREKEHVRFHSTPEFKKMFAAVGLKYVSSLRIAYPLRVHIAEK